jgi:hypothetical protein
VYLVAGGLSGSVGSIIIAAQGGIVGISCNNGVTPNFSFGSGSLSGSTNGGQTLGLSSVDWGHVYQSFDKRLMWSSSAGSGVQDAGIGRAGATALVEINNASAAGVAYLRLNGVAVASLPAASATYQGARGTVTDANATLTAGIGAVVAAGGSNKVPVFCDGTNWRIG